MARINTNISSIIAQFNLGRNNANLDVRLERLATGIRINRGADDPAGLIISERIGTEIAGVTQAIENGDRASSVIATTEASLTEITDLLNSVKGLIVESANTGANSAEEREANQLQIDSAIQSITRISNTASFGGLRLLDGSLAYLTSGIQSSAITRADIFGASFIGSTNVQVNVDVLASAQVGALYVRGDAAALSGGALRQELTLQIAGPRGVQELVFASGTLLTDIEQAIDSRTSLTGVRATIVNGDPNSGIVFQSEAHGSDQFVSVTRVNPPTPTLAFDTLKAPDNAPVISPIDFVGFTAANRDAGRDVRALINGSQATGDGLSISINSPQLSLDLLLTEDLATRPSAGVTSFNITGGGAQFQLGPEVNAAQQANIGVRSVAATQLGGVLVGGGLQFLSSLQAGQPNSIESSVARNDFTTASDIIEQAIDEITLLRGRLGAFERNVLDTNRRSLEAASENLTASRSVIRDTDFAVESSELTRAQILQQSTTSVLQLANQNAQSVLALLG